MGQVEQGLELLPEEIGVNGDALAEQAFGGAAPHRRAALPVDVQLLPGPPSIDDGIDAGDHGLHVVLDLPVPQAGRHDAAPAPVVIPVAHDQRGGPVDQGQVLKRLAPAERVGAGKHELVCLRPQQVGVAVPADAGIDGRTPSTIQRQQRLAGWVTHGLIPHGAARGESRNR
jgi:hypothetical protein